jgi:hypothetical protein
MESRTETFVRYEMRPAIQRQYQPIALRVLAEAGGKALISDIRRAIIARHPDREWDPRYPLEVLKKRGITNNDETTAWLVEDLTPEQVASLLLALDERAVRTVGLRIEDPRWRADAAEWSALRKLVIQRDGEICAVVGCGKTTELQLDHVWRGSLLAAIGWGPSAINSPLNLHLLCKEHHAAKTSEETRLLSLADSQEGVETTESDAVAD